MPASKVPIYSALVANVLIAITKFIAAAFTGSSAMVSEGIHSIVDSCNEVLLLWGIRESKKPADKKRPFGYGKEVGEYRSTKGSHTCSTRYRLRNPFGTMQY